jgi:GT2 family glycosyltransferase
MMRGLEQVLPIATATAGGHGNTVVAVPVHNEAERIHGCLQDLITQTRPPDAILCLLNNCTDHTVAIAAPLAADSPIPIHLVTRRLPPHKANAGFARRLAMMHADRLAGPNGVLLTTDADSRLPPGWLQANIAALERGADAVCGQAVIDPVEAQAIPAHLHADDALECRYAALLDALAAALDPDPADPLPRHTHESGASIAVRAVAYRAAGGIPLVPLGEDRAFIDALRRQDARIRHAPDISVVVSGRVEGRARGGMADTMRRRIRQQDTYVDALLEPAADAYRRVHFRARLRAAWRRGEATAELVSDLHLPTALIAQALSARHFGTAWAEIEARCKLIRRRPVAFVELPRQIAEAEHLLRIIGGGIDAPDAPATKRLSEELPS